MCAYGLSRLICINKHYFIYRQHRDSCSSKIIFFFFIFYSLQLFLAVAVRRPSIPHTTHLRDHSTGSIGYSNVVRPTFRLLPWAILPTHCITRTLLTIIDIRPATVKAVYATLYSLFARGFATTSVATYLGI